MQRASRVALLIGLGALSALAFILGAEPFEVVGGNPIGERLGGSVLVAVYFAVCQFWFARRAGAADAPRWSAVVAMISGLVAVGLMVIVVEDRQQWRLFVAPALIAALVGSTIGVTAGRRSGASSGKRTSRGG